MSKHLVGFARLCVSGSHRAEVGSVLLEVMDATRTKRTNIEDVLHVPVSKFPTSVARNLVVSEARKVGCDLLFMVDDDMWPSPNFVGFAIDFLLAQTTPSVIASPYCTSGAGGLENVCVFEWGSPRNEGAFAQVVNVAREDAARRTGLERVCNMGTGYIAYDLRVFDKVSHPYYDYGYADQAHTAVTETEDCHCHRRLYFAGVPLWVSWDHWSKHWKGAWVDRPVRVLDANIDHVFLEQARAELRAQEKRESPDHAALAARGSVLGAVVGTGPDAPVRQIGRFPFVRKAVDRQHEADPQRMADIIAARIDAQFVGPPSGNGDAVEALVATGE